MTHERRAQILAHVPTITSESEIKGFIWGLKQSGEYSDSDVLAAVEARRKLVENRR